MKESTLVRNIRRAVKDRYPRAFICKLADRHTRGLPDLLILLPGVTLFVEAKTALGALAPIQRAIHAEIEWAGAQIVVARSVAEVLEWLETLT